MDPARVPSQIKNASIARLKRVLFGRFPDRQEENLYQEYMRRQKLKIIPAFVFITIIYLLSRLGLEAVLSNDVVHLARVGIHAIFILLTLLVLAVLRYVPSLSKRAANMCVIALWILVMASLLVDVAVQSHPLAPSGLVGWVQVIIFTTFVVVPWKLRHCVGMTLVIAVVHSVELFVLCFSRKHTESREEETIHTILVEELIADSLLFLGAISLGILVFAFSERKQRRCFVQSKKSHDIGCEIEKQHIEQLRLLQSVLPKYVARLMMTDLEGMNDSDDKQFRRIYMQRFDNVSILFADIVGFTAISSSVSAGELVKILNQLFANFDSLGYKYHQQRIKILGDCYYCVCGITKVEIRPDHAVLGIHMGMSMVDAIRDVRRSTGKEVNMRVGIHTGSVLAGVMGQKQWQYDVLGQQVILANHMESGGLPARVHISQTTKDQLDGQFELEAGNGHDRDDYLKLENMQTYLVKAILKPYPEGTLDADPALLARLKAEAAKELGESEDNDSPVQSLELREGSMDNLTTLQDALFNKRRSMTAMKKLNYWTTWFNDMSTENRYRERRENFSGASMWAMGVVLILATAAKFAVLPITLIPVVVFVVAETILILMAFVSSAAGMLKSKWIPQRVKSWGSAIETHSIPRMIWGLFAILLLITADAAMIMQCDIDRAKEALKNSTNIHITDQNDPMCKVPAYFVHVVHLILLGVSSVVQIEHMTKLVVIIVSSSAYVASYVLVFGPIFDYNDYSIHLETGKVVPSKYDLSVQLSSAAIALLIINRKMEEISRRLFIWREEATHKTDVAIKERHKTEGLIYNILPEHVALYFTGQQRDAMDLYHLGYNNVAVMFAACPNFHDFYNESDINNQGLECLRLLNEIISDYDELLDKPRFRGSITKIKTVGPTYMAASGMVASQELSEPWGGTEVSKYQHVDDMVQFALAMKEELRQINEQSFNTFLLRIGINHGPIIAGVIGVTKPHYDIWGNTVNVASRMESTGMPDQIQVVEETKEVLEEFGYFFQKRGRIHVKGKGELTTFFLMGQDKSKTPRPNNDKMAPAIVGGLEIEKTQKNFLQFPGTCSDVASRSAANLAQAATTKSTADVIPQPPAAAPAVPVDAKKVAPAVQAEEVKVMVRAVPGVPPGRADASHSEPNYSFHSMSVGMSTSGQGATIDSLLIPSTHQLLQLPHVFSKASQSTTTMSKGSSSSSSF